MRGGNRDAEVGHTLVKTREEAAERTETAALTLAASRATGRGEPQLTAQLAAGVLGRKGGSEGGACVHLQPFHCCTAKTTQLKNEDKT